MALDRFEQAGLGPDDGAVAVTGATGAVGVLAIAILSRAGYRVAAVTWKVEHADALTKLGADEVIDAAEIGSTKQGGCVASVGTAGGNTFEGSVLPFIMHGISLVGIVANASWPVRHRLWGQLATR